MCNPGGYCFKEICIMDNQENNTTDLALPLEGVDSEHCAMIVDKALSGVKGISRHKVELNNQRAIISTNDEAEVIPEVVKKIRDIGYDVPSVKKFFPVLNMSCASCAVSTESTLKNVPGVVHAAVNFANGTAGVEYIPTLTEPAKMKQALQSIGYDLMIDETENAKEALEDIHQKNYQTLRRRTIGAILLSIPLVIIGMFFMNMPFANYIMLLLAAPVVIIFGQQFFVNGWKQAKHFSANMDTLVALSTGIAFLFSLFNTFFPQVWTSRGMEAHVYYEASAVIIAFILIGKMLEEKAKGNTSAAIKKLIGLQPNSVSEIMPDGSIVEKPIAAVQIGEILLAKPGEKIAVDGVVISGNSYVDESMISGEPVPVEKQTGSKILAGTINQKGSFQYRAEKIGGDTLLAQIIKMVQDAQGSKAPVQRLVDKIAGIFVPAVMAIAILSMIIWFIAGGDQALSHGVLALVTILIIACPCALGLATPTAIMAGIGKGAENGILIRDAQSLETLKKVNTIILDKTGTITEGKPEVTGMEILNGQDSGLISEIIFSMESKSEHPLGEAVVKYFKNKNTQALQLDQFESITGKGVEAFYREKKYSLGSTGFIREKNISIDPVLENEAQQWLSEAKTVIWLSDEKNALAVLAIADAIKPNSREAISEMQSSGMDVIMLTGDNEFTARAIAKQAGISHFKAGMLPADKAGYIKELQQKGKIVAMVGDGINDSNALAQSDVGIAMGKGSDIAMDVAKMVLVSSDLRSILKGIRLSRKTVNTIKQNLFWAFVYNVLGIPIAAGILYPISGFLLNPMIAGAAMALSSVSVVTNSLRLKTIKL